MDRISFAVAPLPAAPLAVAVVMAASTPIAVTRPNIVDTPSPAATIRDRAATC
jgi:hypothetical protein